MKTVATPFLLLALAACGSYPDEGREAASGTNAEIEKLRVEVKNQNAAQHLYSERLHDMLKNQVELTTKLDVQVRSLQADLKILQEQVKTLEAQVRTILPPGTPSAGPANPPAAGRKPEEIQADIQATLAALASRKLSKEEAATQLKPWPVYAVPAVLDEIQRSPTRFEYVKELEHVLSQLPVRELKVFLREALTQRLARDCAARVVGMVRDSELGRLLEEHVGTEDEDFRLLCGDSLVACRNAAGIPPLVRCLRSGQNATRTIAIAALKRANRGETYGYSPALSPEENAAAIKSWEEWAQKFGPTAFD